MIIIKHGIAKYQSTRITCEGCCCVFIYRRRDQLYNALGKVLVKCPECGELYKIKSETEKKRIKK